MDVFLTYNTINICVSEDRSMENIIDDYIGKKQKDATINHERNYTSS